MTPRPAKPISRRSSFDQSISGTGPFSDLAKLVLRFKPVVAVTPMPAAASLPDLVRAILYFLIEGERKVVSRSASVENP
jgi:hypothetical protein